MNIQQILLKYWGYSSFRPLQEEIIESVLEGHDTLALLPTGGGKSITFQVPALVQEGICIVISPLISLMQDQVENLKRKGIKAVAIYSGMHQREIEIALNNCRFGEFKLLYVSPERLTTPMFRDAVKRMKVSLLAVDEAHCISQWGYDFRPPYLQIAEIKELLPNVPILALTATATPRVIEDIQEKLGFRNGNFFRKSFERNNLTYFVFHEEDKNARILKIIRTIKGSGIIYARNRRQTKEIAAFLAKQKIRATFYHAGLDPKEREKRQNAWMKEDYQVIVATNAFGMGIDKPNVRYVIHVNLPDSIEAYFQEAGRAGRDEKTAYAVLLYTNADLQDLRHNLSLTFPELSVIRNIYECLGNFFGIPIGCGSDLSFDFDAALFSERYRFPQIVTLSALKLLEKEGYILLSEAMHTPSRICIKCDKESLYRFQVENAFFDPFIKVILRSYSGVFSEFVPIIEEDLAKKNQLPPAEVINMLTRLEKEGVLNYIPRSDNPRIVYTENRIDIKNLFLSPETYRNRLKDATERIDAMIRYAKSSHQCRSQALLAYFGETDTHRCGRCDVCIERNKIELSELEYNNTMEIIRPLLNEAPRTLEEIVSAVSPIYPDKVLKLVMYLIDTGHIERMPDQHYSWKE
ncbi:MAG: ATP-dependent DNA helicase RecQ [Bacteroidota bacterium]|nr:ATP-dependent DNA helicase RecQ [Bacteroidota bacterium]